MRQAADRHRRDVEFQVGDNVLLSTRHMRFRQSLGKLQSRFIGPFRITEKVSRAAYKLQLPEGWKIHPVFHVSLLKKWYASTWSVPANAPIPELEASTEPSYQIEKILRWRWVGRGRRRYREFLVTWSGYPLEEAQWIPASNFDDPEGMEEQIRQDKPVEDAGPSDN